MSGRPKLCLIGQVFVDLFYSATGGPPKLRLGGILHAARTLWAMEVPYILAYVAPTYLDRQIDNYASSHGAIRVQKVGDVVGSPNVLVVSEPKESGPQGYEELLREEHTCLFDAVALDNVVSDNEIADFVVFPGGFDLQATLETLQFAQGNVYIDANFAPERISELAVLERGFASVILSTSSNTFLRTYGGDVQKLRDDVLNKHAPTLLLKENRGGSRLFQVSNPDEPVRSAADARPVQHSVGVGDCFDVVYAIRRREMPDEVALAYASFVAAEYASTTHPDTFRVAAQAALEIPAEEIVQLRGISLPWELRPNINIYVAGPDFDYVDTSSIDRVVESLRYHNFTLRLPVRENGQMGEAAELARKQRLCEADLRLLDECQILLAVLPFDDPGTLIEIGLAVERRIPVVVYDPYDRAENLMLTQLPSLVSSSLDEVVTKVFEHASLITQQWVKGR